MALDFIALLPDEEIPETPAACEAASSSDTGEQPAPDAWSITRAHFGADSLELALHEELLDFAEAFRPTRAESAMREAAVERVVSLLASLPSFASASVRPFGSYATGLCLPSSDVDLAVFGTGFESKVQQVEVIGSAKVPIVKYVDGPSGLSVDLCLEQQDGIRSSALATKAARQFPPFRPLVLLLKRYLSSRGLNDTFTGGVGSFLLQLLVISSLQQPPLHPPALSPAACSRENLGRHLLHFFELYGLRLNTTSAGVRVADGGRYFDKRQRGWLNGERPWLLSVENPIDSTHDVGANAFNIRSVRRACAHAYCALLASGTAAAREGEAGREAEREAASGVGGVCRPSRLRLLSAILPGLEAEMGRRFELHAAEEAAAPAEEREDGLQRSRLAEESGEEGGWDEGEEASDDGVEEGAWDRMEEAAGGGPGLVERARRFLEECDAESGGGAGAGGAWLDARSDSDDDEGEERRRRGGAVGGGSLDSVSDSGDDTPLDGRSRFLLDVEALSQDGGDSDDSDGDVPARVKRRRPPGAKLKGKHGARAAIKKKRRDGAAPPREGRPVGKRAGGSGDPLPKAGKRSKGAKPRKGQPQPCAPSQRTLKREAEARSLEGRSAIRKKSKVKERKQTSHRGRDPPRSKKSGKSGKTKRP